jgi:hypothetical protein
MILPLAKLDRRNYAWFVMVDSGRCRLLCCRVNQEGDRCVEEHGLLLNRVGCHARASRASGGFLDDDEEFVFELAGWLRRKVRRHDMDRLVVFASIHMYRLMRNAPLGVLQRRFEQITPSLLELGPRELAEHPSVLALFRDRHYR